MITTEDFLDSLPLVHNPIYDLPGFCLSLIRCDFMHCCFLGLFQITCANMIWELLALDHFCPSAYNVAARLSFAFASLKTYALSHRFTLDLSTFTPSTVGSPSHPDLGCKAHDVRIMVGWLSKQCLQAADKDTPHGKLRATIAWAQEELCFSIEQAPRYLVDDHARNRVVDAGHKFLDLYVSVSETFKDSGTKQWLLLRKAHPLIHMLEDLQCDLHNPRFFSGWTDETLMHKVVLMATGADPRSMIYNTLMAWYPMFIERLRDKVTAR